MNDLGTAGQSRIRVDVSECVARITLAHPPLNIIDLPMMDELVLALREIEAREDVVAVVLSGSGRGFSAGVDIPAHQPETIHAMLSKFHAVVKAVARSRKVTTAVVRGACLGGGAELAMVCDLVYTARDATWGFPEIKLACYPPVASVALSALVGQKRAAELVLTGRSISGAEAMAIGLATGAADSEHLDEMVFEALGRVRRLSPAALGVTKKAFYGWDSEQFGRALDEAERVYLDELMKTHDAREGIAAWMEKRQPRWTGR